MDSVKEYFTKAFFDCKGIEPKLIIDFFFLKEVPKRPLNCIFKPFKFENIKTVESKRDKKKNRKLNTFIFFLTILLKNKPKR